MTPDTVVTLGDFQFQRTEVPERIPFGGDQDLVVHKLPGGARVIDAMGRDDAPLQWSGRFRGRDALARARYLDSLRIAGKPLELAWSELSYTVVIKSFVAEFERFYELPYQIVCEILEDHAAAVTTLPPALEDVVSDDMTALTDTGAEIGDPELIGHLSALDALIGATLDFFNLGEAALGAVFAPIEAALARIVILVAAAETIAEAAVDLGGVTVGDRDLGAALTLQTATADDLALLYELDGRLRRLSANLLNAGQGGAVISMAGGTLQSVAARRFGDPSEWTAIARANDRTDPMISGVADLRIPAKRDRRGGVLSRV